MDEIIIKRNDVVFCTCKGKETFYPKEILEDMYQNGYEILLNGKMIQYK